MPEKNEILKLLNHNYPIDFTDAEFHRDGGSISYIITSNEKKYFLRIIRPELLETAYQSVEIQLYLINSNFPVPAIILANEGQPYIRKINEGKTYLYVLYEYIEGTEPTSDDTENVGELIGKLHVTMKCFPSTLKKQDKHFFIDRYIKILSRKGYSKVDEYKLYGEKLWDKVKNLHRAYCHCDLYRGNILKSTDNKMYVLDFDTSCIAFPMYDITLFCNETDYFEYSDDGFEKSKEWLKCFLRGYLKHCTLAKEEIEAFYYFHAIYHYQLQATIVEIYGVNCNEEGFEDKQLDWIISWLDKARTEVGIHI